MITMRMKLTSAEAIKHKDLFDKIGVKLPILNPGDEFIFDYNLHNCSQWFDEINRIRDITRLLRTANVKNLEFREWDRGGRLVHDFANVLDAMQTLYSAIEECPEYVPPPEPKKKWWRFW